MCFSWIQIRFYFLVWRSSLTWFFCTKFFLSSLYTGYCRRALQSVLNTLICLLWNESSRKTRLKAQFCAFLKLFFQESIATKRRTLQIRQTTNINLKSRNIKRILKKLRASIAYKFKEKPGVTKVVAMFKFTVLTLFGTLLACPWATSSADIIESCSICSSGNFNDIGKCFLRKRDFLPF